MGFVLFRTARKCIFCFVLHLFCFIAVLWQLHSKCHFESIRWHFRCCQKSRNILLGLNSLLNFYSALVFAGHGERLSVRKTKKKNRERTKVCEFFFYGKKLLFRHVCSGVTLLRRRARMEKRVPCCQRGLRNRADKLPKIKCPKHHTIWVLRNMALN